MMLLLSVNLSFPFVSANLGVTQEDRLLVVAFSGSARAGSRNTGLVRYLADSARKVAPKLDISIMNISNWPLFNADLIDHHHVPQEVLDGVAQVSRADAIIISTPEYNYGLAPGTTNTVAWLSKPLVAGAHRAPLVGKPCGLLSAGGALGGMRAQLQARSGFTVFLNMPTMAKPELAVRISPAFDQTGELVDAHERERVDSWLAAFEEWLHQRAVCGIK